MAQGRVTVTEARVVRVGGDRRGQIWRILGGRRRREINSGSAECSVPTHWDEVGETRGLFGRARLVTYEVSGWDTEEAAGSGSWGSRRGEAGHWRGSTYLRGVGAGGGRGLVNILCQGAVRNYGFKIENIGGRVKIDRMLECF